MSGSATIVRREPELGAIPGLARACPPATSLEIWRRACVSRFFDVELARVYDTGVIKMPIYLSLGQEFIPAAVSTAIPGAMTFVQHRAHAWFLALGGAPASLADELLHRPTGCSGGMGGSASFHGPGIGLFGHSGLIGEQVPVAVGAALGSGRPAVAVLGDAAAEEDYVVGALGYAVTKRAPVLFLVEDNDLSILTRVATRRSWSIAEVARGFGMPALDIADDPWLVGYHAGALRGKLPALMNVRTCRHRWHAGTGTDGAPEWNRVALVRETLETLGLGGEATAIEDDARRGMETLWRERSPKR